MILESAVLDVRPDATDAFERGSPEYQHWRELLHHFYEPFPTVEHYRPRFSRTRNADA